MKEANLATVRKIDVHKGAPACEGLWKEDGKPPAGQNSAKTQYISSLIASWGSKAEQAQAQDGFEL